MAIHQQWHQPILRNTDLHLQGIINFQEACGGSAHQTWSCTAQTRPYKRDNLMWGHDNDPLWPGGAGCYYHPEDKEGVYISLQAENAPKEKIKNKKSAHALDESYVFSVQWELCMHQACLPMQSSTDGHVGGWVLSAHRSSCGSVVPLLFTTQARRACQTRSTETYQGWILCFGFYAILQCLP